MTQSATVRPQTTTSGRAIVMIVIAIAAFVVMDGCFYVVFDILGGH